jgi:hypothetical protein
MLARVSHLLTHPYLTIFGFKFHIIEIPYSYIMITANNDATADQVGRSVEEMSPVELLQDLMDAEDVERELREMYRHLFEIEEQMPPLVLQNWLFTIDLLCPALRQWMADPD